MPLVDSAFLAASIFVCLFAAYESFVVRQAIPNPVYRKRALWTGMVALAIVPYGLLIMAGDLNVISASSNPYSPEFTGIPNLLLYVTYIALTIVDSLILFFWIDSTIRVAYELDFFHSDSLRWKKFRKYAWTVYVVGAIGGGASLNQLLYLIFGIVLAIPITYAAAVLIRSLPRIYDQTMKRHVKWMGLLLIAVIVEIATNSIYFYLNFPLLAFACCLYMAVRSLSIKSHVEQAGP